MIFNDFAKAIGQLTDSRFRKVLWMGLGLTVALLFGAYAAVLWLVSLFAPETVTLPWIGEVTWVNDLISGASILLMMVLSVFLMVPVASAFTSMFLDEVAQYADQLRHVRIIMVCPRMLNIVDDHLLDPCLTLSGMNEVIA